ncbi:hydroxymethylglutaryl-CoA lyase [Alteribacillus iranensis]|uniref:Hydroxymethylglutaryl-CoA lyase n=1 Tax=Alteribacillus iranensis TaxID=930128 RepID=A0A1I2BEI2_9BACI|nr:hydroxymethylglutaryl-CoA lyase [Alteribacillus iranensis]SFE54555.1 hydroxymethylglutaryl-CoA lyase [Alteribacillus iranensis]
MGLPKEVNITEVCPRDGFQSLPDHVPTETKIDIINRLIDCGFSQMEVTSFVHPKAVPQMKDADEVLKGVKKSNNVLFRALVPNLRGLERAIAADVEKVKLMLSATDSHSLHNANAATMEAMDKFIPLVERAKESNTKVAGSIAVAFGCPYEGEVPTDRLLEICQRYEDMGITDISLADTTGMAHPVLVKRVISTLREEKPHFHFSLHLHNTRGMAFANAIAGLEEGITDFDSSAGGIGGCPYAPNASGNIATEDIVHGFEEMGIKTNIDLDAVIEVGRILAEQFPAQSDSFILKAGKSKDLVTAPGKQVKIGEK